LHNIKTFLSPELEAVEKPTWSALLHGSL